MSIALWWIGAGPLAEDAMEFARTTLQQEFARPVELGVRRTDARDAYDLRRKQYSSSRLVRWLSEFEETNAERVLGVVDVDLFIPVLSFVFGEAQLGGRAAVVSTFRLIEQGPLPTGAGWRGLFTRAQKPQDLFRARLAKECAHELGHTYGLVHCSDPTCVMARSPTITHVDVKSARFCMRCKGRLARLGSGNTSVEGTT